MAASMRTVVKVNPYQTEKYSYKFDRVLLALDDDTFTVTATPCDQAGTAIEGASAIATVTNVSYNAGLLAYKKILNKLQQGDVLKLY